MQPLVARFGVLVLTAAVACQAAQTPGPQPSTSGASAASASPAASAAPSPTQSYPTREGTCAMRVSQSFTLANDMTCTGDGMVVISDTVTVDLGGHTLTGPGMGPQTWPLPQLDSVGVRVGGHTGVTIRNGKTTAFSTGIYFIDMVSSSIESVTTLRNRFGFYIHASQKITVKDSDVEFNIYGLHLQNSDDCVLVNNLLARQPYNSPGGYGLYLYASSRNRVTDNTIDSNINWGIWFSDAKENVIFHNNVVGNNPPVSDNTEGSNVWYDKQTKEGNWWADYKGKDADNDSIGDTPYPILGPGGMVDPYPFVAKDGWKTKRRATIDHYEPAAARPPRVVTIVALVGGAEPLARSYKHNHVFVATTRGIDLLYLNLGGRTPYTIPLDGEPTAMVMAGSGTRIYAAIAAQHVIDVVDTEQYAVVDRIKTDVLPTSLAISPREDILYIGSASGAEAVTIRDRSVVSSAAFLGSVVDLAVSPNGDQLYVALAGLSHAIAVLDAPHLRVAHVIELDNDPSRILVASY